MPYADAMTPMLSPATLALIAREEPLSDPDYADYCIESASYLVADEGNHPEWIGLDATGATVPVVPARRRVVMIAEQLAKRAYLNPDAIVAEGNIGPIGGDRTVEDFARTFEFTPAEQEYLQTMALGTTGGGSALWTLTIESGTGVIPRLPDGTINLPDLDPRADPWPLGSPDDAYAYTPLAP